MRKNYLFLLIALFALKSGYAQTKHALIFAVGEYPKAGGWKKLASARDAVLLSRALERQGFSNNNIRVLGDAEVTASAISAALIKLTQEVKEGDIAVIHFSTHGAQVEDNNGDELDGKDECIVPFDAIASSVSKNFEVDKEKYFRDDELGIHLYRLRSKLGRTGDLIVFMDLCTSGSATRGISTVRGDQPPLLSASFNAARFGKDTAGLQSELSPVVPGQQLSDFIVISAAADEKEVFQVKDEMNLDMGSLTYAICRAFERMEPSSSYRSLFSEIKSLIYSKTHNQQPVMEGNEMDRQIFGGRLVTQKSYSEMVRMDKNLVTINAGKFSGLNIGAKVGMYPAGIPDPAQAQAMAIGTVVDAENYSAVVNFTSVPADIGKKAYWYFITQPVYKMPQVAVHIVGLEEDIAHGFSADETAKIKVALGQFSSISFKGIPQLTIKKGKVFDSVNLSASGYLYRLLKISGSDLIELKEAISDFVRYQFLQNIEIKNPAINAQVKLFRMVEGKVDSSSVAVRKNVFREGEEIVVGAKNNGAAPVYLNILDLSPNGAISPVFPNKAFAIYPHDLKIGPGETKLFTNFAMSVQPPFGTEIYKIFVSNTQIDLEGISTGSNNARGEFSILEELVRRSYQAGERGTETQSISNADGSTYNILFSIVPAGKKAIGYKL